MTTDVDAIFEALADPTRRAIIEALRAKPCPAGELASRFRLSPPAMSRHLRVLRLRGLVVEEHAGPDARVRQYRLRREPFQKLAHWLAGIEALWTDQLDAFREHVERSRKGRPH